MRLVFLFLNEKYSNFLNSQATQETKMKVNFRMTRLRQIVRNNLIKKY